MKKHLTIVMLLGFVLAMLGGTQALAKEEVFPNWVKTHIGELTFDHGIPTEKTSEKLYYELDYMYFLKELGIEKNKPFKPNRRQKEILADAVVVGEAMAKNTVFRERLPGVLRDDGRRLILGRVEGGEPGDALKGAKFNKLDDLK